MPTRAETATERLLELAAGYQASQVLFAFLELELPRRLAAGPLRPAALARELGLHPLAADRFLNACVALRLIEREGDGVRLASDFEPLLGDGDLAASILARRESHARWNRLVERLRAWVPPAAPLARGADRPEAVAALASQHALSLRVGEALAEAHDFGPHRRMLDLGAGTAAMSIAICRRHLRLEAVAFDRPAVAPLARARVAAAGLAGRVAVVAGDFLADPLPGGCDVALLASVLSTASERAERELLARIAASLPAGGVVIVSGWMLGDASDGPLLPALFCLEDIMSGAPDVERPASTYASWLDEAGFRDVRHAPFLPPWSALVARRAR